MTLPSRALVLSGGGNAGAAWMGGFIIALQEQALTSATLI